MISIWKKTSIRLLVLVLCWGVWICLAGCQGGAIDEAVNLSAGEKLAVRLGKLPTVQKVESWQVPDYLSDEVVEGLEITTNHYQIFTTHQDPLIMSLVPPFLESAFKSYAKLLGCPVATEKKLLVYLFDNREQWEAFTRQWVPEQSEIYLKITAGAYYVKGACVVYRISRTADFSVLAHEGWHQFVDELFRFRLPAWLDESLATNFEAFVRENGRIRFEPRRNGSRLFALKKAVAGGQLLSLGELLVLDAGRVVSHTPELSGEGSSLIATYYAQLYALGRFLQEEKYGRHVLKFQKMLNGAQMGRWPLSEADAAEAVQRLRNPSRDWNGRVGPLVFDYYISPSRREIEAAYRSYCYRIAAQARIMKSR
ncbi:MAG: hypothetical protein JXD22_00520 [Sedimentisphaerales bacterium]|nr:hypothetical protein [Sedimentisphaerales bacterium]